ncbi:MAG TPA: PorP/SprF family type IX secretion system membrane protein [Saprospiraceae bacterium]|nr:PorP/SprF family type IX secretion system membrane protein [Saprospiraceae bacterium]
MKTRNIGLSVLLSVLGFSSTLFGQDYATALKTPAVYTHYFTNLFLVNPANTGFSGEGKLLFNFRNQWAGFDGSPKGLTLGIDASPANNMGLGALIYSENFGVANRFQGQVNYAYNFKASDEIKMAFGIAGSYIQYHLDNEAITDPLHENPDPKINDAVNGEKYFAADFGFYTEIQDRYRLGISIPHLVQTRLDDSNTTNNEPSEEKKVNFTGFLGGIWKLPEYRMVIEPSIGVRKISDVPFGTDFNVLARLLDDKLYAGFTYSYNPSWHRIAFLAGFKLDRLGFMYSYDQSYLEFQNYNDGSHEITLSFGLTKSKPKPTMMEEKSDEGMTKMPSEPKQ